MNSISIFKPTYKSASLSSVSRGAICSLILSDTYLLCIATSAIMPTRYGEQNMPRGVRVFLVWLQIWLDWLRGQKYVAGSTRIREPAIVNRHCRRRVHRKVPPAHSYNLLFHLRGKTLSRTQFLELMCGLMPLGRVRIYGICFWGTVLQRRALLICYDHGWWHAPISKMGRVSSGLWRAHLWPS